MKYIVTLSDGRKLEVKSKAMVQAIQRNAVVYALRNESGTILNFKFVIK